MDDKGTRIDPKTGVSVFHNMIHVEFGYMKNNEDWVEVLEMLNFCPKLQVLVIDKMYLESLPQHGVEVADWSYRESVPVGISSLRSCRLNSYKGLKGELRFAEYVMGNAEHLQSMIISSSIYANPEKSLEGHKSRTPISTTTSSCHLSSSKNNDRRRRVTLHEQMSASDSSRGRVLTGLTLDDVLANQKRPSSTPPRESPPTKNRTLLDIIKDDETNKKDRRSWKAFKDKIRLKRAGSAWTSSIHIPTSDVPVPNPNSRIFTQFGRRNSVRFPTQTLPSTQDPTHSDSDMASNYMTHQVEDLEPATEDSTSPSTAAPAIRPQFSRRGSTRFAVEGTEANPAGSLRPQLSRKNSTNMPSEPYRRGRVVTFRDSFDDEEAEDGEKLGEGRALSAREAVAAQEAAEAAAQEEEGQEQAPVMMSLMDLLEETDREMGLEGSRYILSDEEEDEDEDEDGEDDGVGSMEHTCCICMVRHKAASFIPCGHTFCRMCSRELMIDRYLTTGFTVMLGTSGK
ncbi:unnamed protein product [Sphenostylis stenocarpa]|uniref:RING-type domain-containing protein n=1 Tax=Sphenostylis stenocarpa TaxID=92480 RepID=A0AA86RLK7_9FABA|nr:unnamed protein product [Sphenostylis stenocarpa]